MIDGEPGVKHGAKWAEDIGTARLMRAAANLYYAAHWTPDRDCDAGALWKELRDAAGLEPGHSPRPTGA